jgi:hypothetical protein
MQPFVLVACAAWLRGGAADGTRAANLAIGAFYFSESKNLPWI